MGNLLGLANFDGEGPSPMTRAAALESATRIGKLAPRPIRHEIHSQLININQESPLVKRYVSASLLLVERYC